MKQCLIRLELILQHVLQVYNNILLIVYNTAVEEKIEKNTRGRVLNWASRSFGSALKLEISCATNSAVRDASDRGTSGDTPSSDIVRREFFSDCRRYSRPRRTHSRLSCVRDFPVTERNSRLPKGIPGYRHEFPVTKYILEESSTVHK